MKLCRLTTFTSGSSIAVKSKTKIIRMRTRWPHLSEAVVNLRGQAARFIGVGLLSYALGLSMSAVLREALHFSAEHAVALTLAVLLVLNFWLSRRFVFLAGGAAIRQFARFGVTSLAMRAGEYALFYALMHLLRLHYLSAFTAALLISNVLKFVLYRQLVFRPDRRTEVSTPRA